MALTLSNRTISLTRRILSKGREIGKRHDSIFTKYREPPNGFLFNEKPLKPGEKRKWEWWELPTYLGFGCSALVLFIGAYWRPPGSDPRIWVRAEALRRIAEKEAAEAEAAGIVTEEE